MKEYYARPKLSTFQNARSYEELEQKLSDETRTIHTILENLSEPSHGYSIPSDRSIVKRSRGGPGASGGGKEYTFLNIPTSVESNRGVSEKRPASVGEEHHYVGAKPAEVEDFSREKTTLVAFTGTEYSKELLQARGYDVLEKHPAADELHLPAPVQDKDKKEKHPEGQYFKENINFDKKIAAKFDLSNVKVLVIDSGLDVNHPEFAGINLNIAESCDFEREEYVQRGMVTKHTYAGGEIFQKHYHGTAVSGLVCGNSHGIAHGVELVVYNVTYFHDALTRTRFEKSILYAGICRPDIILMSWGVEGNNPVFQDDIDYIQSCCNDSTLIVAAIGNNGPNTHFSPSDYSNVLAVGASDKDDKLWMKPDGSGSSFGSFQFNKQKITKPDIYAPGARLEVPVPAEIIKSGYQTYSGTSFSAPLVAGTAAYVISKMKRDNKEFTAAQVKELLIKTGKDFQLPESCGTLPGKLLDFSEALQAL